MDIWGILSLIFGGIGTVGSYWYIGAIPCIVGIVLGIVGIIESYSDNKLSIMGLLISIFGVIVSVFFVVSDLDSGSLVVEMDKLNGNHEETAKGDDFMRFHKEGWTPDQTGEEVVVMNEEPTQEEESEGESKTPYWIHDQKDSEITEPEGQEMENPPMVAVQPEENTNDSKKESEDQETKQVNEKNNVIYQDEYIIISYDGMEEDDFLEDYYKIKFVVENISSRTLEIQVRETSINGNMVEPMCSMEVSPSKKVYSNMSIYGEDAERTPFNSIQNIETKFHVFDWNDGAFGYDTENIKIK